MVLARHADLVGEEGWPVVADTISSVSSMKNPKNERSAKASAAERAAVQELVRAARGRGEDITGPDGLLKSITATVLESALEEEMEGVRWFVVRHEALLFRVEVRGLCCWPVVAGW